MEIVRMDYRFTAILIILIVLLAIFGKPAQARNEYLNDGNTRCGEIDVSVSGR